VTDLAQSFWKCAQTDHHETLIHPFFQLVGWEAPTKLNIVLKIIGLGDAELSQSWPKLPSSTAEVKG
jgi:hypothetical protein